MGRRWRTDAERRAHYLGKSVDKAVREHEMIEDGDRILVGVSGGKDSMSLLRLLVHRLRQSPEKYSLVAVHVNGDARGSDGVDAPRRFLDWLEGEGVPYHVRDIAMAPDEPLPMNCERCSRNRRRTLFAAADELGCNKVALGHHLEDFSHTALMNLFQHGRLETMAFRRDYFGGRFGVIRPLAYIRESELERFAKACEFPVMESSCPMAEASCRRSARDLMTLISRDFRQANENVIRAASEILTGEDRAGL